MKKNFEKVAINAKDTRSIRLQKKRKKFIYLIQKALKNP